MAINNFQKYIFQMQKIGNYWQNCIGAEWLSGNEQQGEK